MVTGFVTGYTSGTVSIDGSTYTHAAGMKVIRIVNDNGTFKTEDVKLADLYMKNVEFLSDKGQITFILEADAPEFTASANGQTITVTPDFDLANFADSRLTAAELTDKDGNKTDLTGSTVAFGAENTIEVTLAETIALENGEYKLTFKIGSKSFTVTFTYEATEAPEQPEQPEQPENPETPEQPEQPENPETPENPDQPEQPETPETPENPEQPENPETPENPDNNDGVNP